MSRPHAERAIADALRVGRAILKTISPNDVGLTGGHQAVFYLPKTAWRLFTPQPPVKDTNHDHRVHVVWQDGRETESTVKWYGKGTRSEYRLTGFNRERDFPFLDEDCVGALLVVVPERPDHFLAYVLDLEEEIEEVQAALGVEVVKGWAAYDAKARLSDETEDGCLNRSFQKFASDLTAFPRTRVFSDRAWTSLVECVNAFARKPVDTQLLRLVEAEYALFRTVERRICEPEIIRVFKSVDDFLATAQTILQRRKARAGRSLEHHVERLLQNAGLPFDKGVVVDGTRPDIILPGREQYEDSSFPEERLILLGIKTTCKDRWRQVTREAPRARHRFILTMQQGVSSQQMREMGGAGIRLVVPKALHKKFPPVDRPNVVSLKRFIDEVRRLVAV